MHLIWYLKYRHHSILFTDTYKYLGVQLDQTLSLRHLESTYKKAAGRLYLLKRVRFQLTTDAALSIYKSMLLPLFTYCSILNANPSRTHQERIDNFENRAQRIVYRSGNPNGNQQLISVKELNKKRVCLQVFKCMIGETCENFQNYFEIMNNKTRNRNCLIRLRVAKLECYRKSFCFNGAREFNELPLKIRSSKTASEFLKFYKECFNI